MVSFPAEVRHVSLLQSMQTSSGTNLQPPIQWDSGAISAGVKHAMVLITYLRLVLRLRMCAAVIFSPASIFMVRCLLNYRTAVGYFTTLSASRLRSVEW